MKDRECTVRLQGKGVLLMTDTKRATGKQRERGEVGGRPLMTSKTHGQVRHVGTVCTHNDPPKKGSGACKPRSTGEGHQWTEDRTPGETKITKVSGK